MYHRSCKNFDLSLSLLSWFIFSPPPSVYVFIFAFSVFFLFRSGSLLEFGFEPNSSLQNQFLRSPPPPNSLVYSFLALSLAVVGLGFFPIQSLTPNTIRLGAWIILCCKFHLGLNYVMFLLLHYSIFNLFKIQILTGYLFLNFRKAQQLKLQKIKSCLQDGCVSLVIKVFLSMEFFLHMPLAIL